MRRAIEAIAAGLLAVLVAWAPARADEPAERAALSLVTTLVQESHSAMVAGDTQALKQAISNAFAFDIWERFLVGDAAITPDERGAVRALLPGFLANLYAERFGKGLEAAPEVVDARTVRRDVLVKARIPRKDAAPLPVEYRVREIEDAGPRVIDIMVGGVSFLVLKREEFKAIIKDGGGATLIDFMRAHAI